MLASIKTGHTIDIMQRLMVLLRWVGLIALLFPVAAAAVDTSNGGMNRPEIVISEFMAAGSTANEEFIELFNDSNKAIVLDNTAALWKLQYFSASKNPTTDTPSFTVNLTGTFYPKRRFLIAHSGYLADKANVSFTSNLANTSGYLRIVSFGSDGTKLSSDLVGWGSAQYAEGQPVATLAASKSYKRKINEDGRLIDTNHNLNDFFASSCLSPESTNFGDNAEIPSRTEPTCLGSWSIATVVPSIEEPASTGQTETPAANTEVTNGTNTNTDKDPNEGLQPVELSELFPNPAAPKTDDTDEYIELYNPNDRVYDLAGYRLETGMTYSKGYTFENGTVGAKNYAIFLITDTKLQLANTESQVRLLDPEKNVISETASYVDAPDGSAWSLINDSWQWTTSPSPGEANVLTVPVVINKTTAASSKTKSAKAAKAAVTPKKAAASNTKPSSVTEETLPGELQDESPLHPAVLAGVGLSAVGYALYEYRRDFGNRIFQFRRYLRTRRASRASLPG